MVFRHRISLVVYLFAAATLFSPGAGKAQSFSSLEKPSAPIPKITADSFGRSEINFSAQQTSSTYTRPKYEPITGQERLKWVLLSTVGPESLLGGVFTAGIGTARNKPEEYGPHWEGFAKRYGMRFTGVATSNVMEAGLGSLWGEDPRYEVQIGKPFGARFKSVFVQAVMARRRDGHFAPAYARFIAVPGNNFLSNTWRADSEATTNAALARTAYGFLGKVTGNAFAEFWPTAKKHLFKRK